MKKTTITLLLVCTAVYAQQKGTFTDSRDGKTYKTVKIGTQTWMAQNLDYAGADGDIGACSDNDPKSCQNYGRLYDWESAMLACPEGWHLPSEDEWRSLATSAGGMEVAGQKLKARNGWEKWDCEWTTTDDRGRAKKVSKCNSDSYGFSALPSSSKNTFSDWWTATESHWGAVDTYMLYNSTEMMFQGKEYKMYQSNNNYSKSKKLSVRCLKGEGKLPTNLAAKKTAMATAEAEKKAEKAAEIANPLTTEVTNKGTVLRGSTLAKKLAWLDRNAESHNTYIIEVNANENIATHTFEYKGTINITIILRGDGENRIIRLKSHGNMFTVKANVTFILENNVTLHGHNQNTGSMVNVNGGIFTMDGGNIIGNSIKDCGGGVRVDGGTFTMNGGTINENSAIGNNGGGVCADGTFTMNGGTISKNFTDLYGGGVSVRGPFVMTGGIISGNSAAQGGGVNFYGGYQNHTFSMHGGTITNNTATKYGGGVFMDEYARFNKTGGTITGYNSDSTDGNAVRDHDGTIARRGHAVYVNEKLRRETTAGLDGNMSLDRGTGSLQVENTILPENAEWLGIPFEYHQGYGNLQIDKSVSDNLLSIAGKHYKKGIGTHANGKLNYNLGGKYQRLTAIIGLDEKASCSNGFQMKIFVDGNLLRDTGKLVQDQEYSLDIPLNGINQLVFEIDGLGDIGCDHVDIAVPILTKKETQNRR